jgi:hypothetical protein
MLNVVKSSESFLLAYSGSRMLNTRSGIDAKRGIFV